MTAVCYREIDSYPGYRVGTDGSVWTCRSRGHGASTSGWQRRAIHQGRNGYWHVGLRQNGKLRNVSVHRLVLTTFVGLCPPGHQALHWDGNKDNNALSNLRWGTRKENAADTIRLGRQICGAECRTAKLTEKKVVAILQDLMNGEDQQVVAEKYGCTQSNISEIKRGMSWKHVPRPAGWPPAGHVYGENHYNAKLTRADVEAILRDLAAGKPQQAIADQYGCNQMNVSKIKRGVSWKEVPRPAS
jgi:uncharacterized protein (DUF433 family)